MKAQFLITASWHTGAGKERINTQTDFKGEIEVPDPAPGDVSSLPKFAVSLMPRLCDDHPELHDCHTMKITLKRLS